MILDDLTKQKIRQALGPQFADMFELGMSVFEKLQKESLEARKVAFNSQMVEFAPPKDMCKRLSLAFEARVDPRGIWRGTLNCDCDGVTFVESVSALDVTALFVRMGTAASEGFIGAEEQWLADDAQLKEAAKSE